MSEPAPDRYDLYERAAQSPDMQARFLRALHEAPAGEPVTLGEDFCGTGAVARAFLALDPRHRAVCVDRDPEPLERLRRLAGDEPRLAVVRGDAAEADAPAGIIAALNFSIGERRTREDLLAYLRAARSRLVEQAGAPGVMVLDVYGGTDAFVTGESEVELRDGVRYVWEQRHADPLTGMVENAMHFLPAEGPELRDAFVYHWRLWSVPELADALAEAGFARLAVYDRFGDCIDDAGRVYPWPVTNPDELDENFVVYIAAWTR
ncbi:MAG: class I SAM-dependent methyltransferase [Planctomycetota bacterium]|nr:MAG: class I SAM-dependent methyltransferase [Planctomycetota bacterium]